MCEPCNIEVSAVSVVHCCYVFDLHVSNILGNYVDR